NHFSFGCLIGTIEAALEGEMFLIEIATGVGGNKKERIWSAQTDSIADRLPDVSGVMEHAPRMQDIKCSESVYECFVQDRSFKDLPILRRAARSASTFVASTLCGS